VHAHAPITDNRDARSIDTRSIQARVQDFSFETTKTRRKKEEDGDEEEEEEEEEEGENIFNRRARRGCRYGNRSPILKTLSRRIQSISDRLSEPIGNA